MTSCLSFLWLTTVCQYGEDPAAVTHWTFVVLWLFRVNQRQTAKFESPASTYSYIQLDVIPHCKLGWQIYYLHEWRADMNLSIEADWRSVLQPGLYLDLFQFQYWLSYYCIFLLLHLQLLLLQLLLLLPPTLLSINILTTAPVAIISIADALINPLIVDQFSCISAPPAFITTKVMSPVWVEFLTPTEMGGHTLGSAGDASIHHHTMANVRYANDSFSCLWSWTWYQYVMITW